MQPCHPSPLVRRCQRSAAVLLTLNGGNLPSTLVPALTNSTRKERREGGRREGERRRRKKKTHYYHITVSYTISTFFGECLPAALPSFRSECMLWRYRGGGREEEGRPPRIPAATIVVVCVPSSVAALTSPHTCTTTATRVVSRSPAGAGMD